MTKTTLILRQLNRFLMLEVGAFLAAVALEIFLVPNRIIDGGIIGISIIASHLSKWPLGLFIFLLNLPFLFIGYRQIGKTFVINTLFAVVSLSIWVSVLHPVPGLTHDMLLAAVFGGVVLGVGVGLIIRYGGSLDGTEIVAIIVNKRFSFSVGEIVMFFNLFILSSAGFVFSWDKAMYSLLAYFVAFKVIDITIDGLDEAKTAMIVTDRGDELAEIVMARLGRGVTFLDAKGAYSGRAKNVLFSVITRLEVAKLKSIINEIDPNAFVTIHDVSDLMGGKHKKRAIH